MGKCETKFSLSNLLCFMITFHYVIYAFLTVVMPNMCNKYVIIFFFVVYSYMLVNLPKKMAFCITFTIGVFLIANSYNESILNIIHVDFISFVLLFTICWVYTDINFRKEYRAYLIDNRKLFDLAVLLFFVICMITILQGYGLRGGQGVTIPILYGPFTLEHNMAYVLIGIYCGVSFLYRIDSKAFYLMVKLVCMLGIICTAVRTALLAFFVILIVDYSGLKKEYVKCLIPITGVCILGYLGLFTNILTQNAMIEKTLSAIQSGSISNNRGRFATIVLEEFSEQSKILPKLFGMGMQNVRFILQNHPMVKVAIHAHNEYVNVLVAYGFLGLFIYLLSQVRQTFKLYKMEIAVFVQLFLFVLAFFNGLAFYTVFTPSLIIVYIFFEQIDEQKYSSEEGELINGEKSSKETGHGYTAINNCNHTNLYG